MCRLCSDCSRCCLFCSFQWSVTRSTNGVGKFAACKVCMFPGCFSQRTCCPLAPQSHWVLTLGGQTASAVQASLQHGGGPMLQKEMGDDLNGQLLAPLDAVRCQSMPAWCATVASAKLLAGSPAKHCHSICAGCMQHGMERQCACVGDLQAVHKLSRVLRRGAASQPSAVHAFLTNASAACCSGTAPGGGAAGVLCQSPWHGWPTLPCGGNCSSHDLLAEYCTERNPSHSQADGLPILPISQARWIGRQGEKLHLSQPACPPHHHSSVKLQCTQACIEVAVLLRTPRVPFGLCLC